MSVTENNFVLKEKISLTGLNLLGEDVEIVFVRIFICLVFLKALQNLDSIQLCWHGDKHLVADYLILINSLTDLLGFCVNQLFKVLQLCKFFLSFGFVLLLFCIDQFVLKLDFVFSHISKVIILENKDRFTYLRVGPWTSFNKPVT